MCEICRVHADRHPGHFSLTGDRFSMFHPAESCPLVQVLFIKRAHNPRDKWSGHIALPGGRQAPAETDEQTAVREVRDDNDGGGGGGGWCVDSAVSEVKGRGGEDGDGGGGGRE
jgi:hypothetical protein